MNEQGRIEESQGDSLEDLNTAAIAEFRSLLETDTTVLAPWKEAAMELSAEGVPQDLSGFQKLLEGITDATTEEPQS